MIRKISAVVAGAVVAFGLVALLETISHALYPLPAGLDFRNPAHLKVYAATLPLGALWCVLGAWLVATFAGCWLAIVIARERPMFFAALVGSLVLVATIANLLMIPHPVWFSITATVTIPLAAFCASLFAPRGKLEASNSKLEKGL